VYPLNLTSDRYFGEWSWQGARNGRFLKPALASNVTVQYAMREAHAAANLSFTQNAGEVQLRLVSVAPYAAVMSLQDVVGELALFDGPKSSGHELLVPCRGVYAADAGLVYLVGSTLGGRVSLFNGPAPVASPSLSPSASPSPSPSPSPPSDTATATSSPAVVLPLPSAPAGNGSRALVNDGGLAGLGVALGAGSGGLSAVPSADASAADRCDILLALRFRPTGFDSSFVPPSVEDAKRAAEEVGGRVLLEQEECALLWPVRSLSDSAGSISSGLAAFLRPRFLTAILEGRGPGYEPAVRAVLNAASTASLSLAPGPPLSALLTGRPVLPPPVGRPGARRLSASPGVITRPPTYGGMRFVPLVGVAVSPNCNFSLNVSVSTLVYDEAMLESKGGWFILLATGWGTALLMVSTYQIILSAFASAAARVSLASVGMQWVLDGLMAFLFLTGGVIVPSLLSSFILPAFSHFFLFVVLEVRFMLLIRKARAPTAFNGGVPSFQRELCRLYLMLYPTLLAAFFVLWVGSASAVRALLFAASSYWVPQIVHSAARDSRSGLTRSYILINSAARLFPALYLLACPSNVAYFLWPPEAGGVARAWGKEGGWEDPPTGSAPWMLPPSTPAFLTPAHAAVYWSWARFALALTAWQVAQVAVLLAQSSPLAGPRFFVPYAFLPKRYDYHRLIMVEGGRVMPDPAATAPWARTPVPEPAPAPAPVPAPEGEGEGAPAPAAALPPATAGPTLGTTLATAAASAVTDAAASARAAGESLVWFAACCRVLIADGLVAGRAAARRYARSARARGGSLSRGIDRVLGREEGGGHISRTVSGPVEDGGEEGSAAGGAAGGWLELMSPRQRSGRYARLGGASTGGAATAVGGAVEDLPLMAGGGSGEGKVPTGEGGGGVAGVDVEVGEGGSPESPVPSSDGLVGSPTWGGVDCVVCMDVLSFPTSRGSYMVTPCDHLFHTQCLRPWLEVGHADCPTCRAPLPDV